MAMLPARRSGRMISPFDPAREFEDIYDRMGRLMSAAFGDMGLLRPDGAWSPLAELSENDDAYLVRAEVPGVSKDNVNIELHDRELVIAGEVPEHEEGRRHQSTRRSGRFEYRTYLPGDVNADQVDATLADGVLTVTLPKSEATKPRRIAITS
jgi:HSP20 family protein